MSKTTLIAAASAITAAVALQWHTFLAIAVVGLGMIAVLLYPTHERKKKAQSLDAAIAREGAWMASEMQRLPLEKVLELHAHGALREPFENVLRKARMGIPLRLAVHDVRVDSAHSKKFFELLRFACAHAPPSKALAELSKEIALANEAKAQAYASKLSFFGVALITASAIIPSLAAAYFLLGSTFLSAQPSNELILALFLFAFPLANVALLAYVHELAPVIA